MLKQSSKNPKNHNHLYFLSSRVSRSTLSSATSHCTETETTPNPPLPINTTLSTVDDDRIDLTPNHDHIYVTPNPSTHDILTTGSTCHSDRPQDTPNPPPPINTTLSTVDDNRIYLTPGKTHGIISTATTHCDSAVASPNIVVLRVLSPPFVGPRTFALPTSSLPSTPFTTLRFQPQATVPDEIPFPRVPPVHDERRQTETVTQTRRRPRATRRAFSYMIGQALSMTQTLAE